MYVNRHVGFNMLSVAEIFIYLELLVLFIITWLVVSTNSMPVNKFEIYNLNVSTGVLFFIRVYTNVVLRVYSWHPFYRLEMLNLYFESKRVPFYENVFTCIFWLYLQKQ